MAQPNYDTLKRDIDHLRNDIAEVTRTLRDMGIDGRDGAGRRIRDAVGSATDGARRAAEETVHRIEERPLVSMAGAFGAGVVLGALLLNRRS